MRLKTIVGSLLVALIVVVGLPGVAQARGSSVVVRLGSRGSAVVVLQRDLHLPADGVFGRQTRRAVITFQRRHHLSADGVVGARTWQALGGAPWVSSTPVRRAATPVYRSSWGARAVALAAAQRGKPYRWGAAGPYSFDCSGLVQWVYARLGIRVPRTTWTQYAGLRHVSRSAMQPGDLIFVDKLNHVGIYAGYGFMWHAPHTGSHVKLSIIWDRHYLVARV